VVDQGICGADLLDLADDRVDCDQQGRGAQGGGLDVASQVEDVFVAGQQRLPEGLARHALTNDDSLSDRLNLKQVRM